MLMVVVVTVIIKGLWVSWSQRSKSCHTSSQIPNPPLGPSPPLPFTHPMSTSRLLLPSRPQFLSVK